MSSRLQRVARQGAVAGGVVATDRTSTWSEGGNAPRPPRPRRILKPGEMSLHHVKVVHGSEPNRSNDRRIGLAIRYIPTDIKQLKVRDSATLVRGTDRHKNFDHEPRPRRDLSDEALAAHADAIGRQVKALYSGTDKQEFRA